MKKFIYYFLNDPKNLEEMKESEISGLRSVFVAHFITCLLIGIVVDLAWIKIHPLKDPVLFFILLLNMFGFFVTAVLAFLLSKKVFEASTILSLEDIKRTFYKVYIVFTGIPYLALIIWIYHLKDFSSFILMTSIFLGTLIFIYFRDWKKFLELKASIS